jgi:sporulation protein YlmC with PRC-barrel domain
MAGIETDESIDLIASNKVEGTTVYNPSGEKLGTIYNFMLDKRTGQVEYAVLKFGGMLGIGSDYYPLPWDVLEYDEDLGGFSVEIDKDALKDAPHFAENQDPIFTPEYGSQVYTAYGLEFPARFENEDISRAAE